MKNQKQVTGEDRRSLENGVGRGISLWKRYALTSAFCLLFSQIYAHFSHGVRSPWMGFLFLWPLALGGLPAFLQERGILPAYPETRDHGLSEGMIPGSNSCIGEWMHDLYRFGVAALTAASLLKGILEIAGTDSVYPDYLLAGGAVMLFAGCSYYLLRTVLFRKRK